MLDLLFNSMAIDSYAHWTIHYRRRRLAGDIEISVPHGLADAHIFLRHVVMSVGELSDHNFNMPPTIDVTSVTKRSGKKTRLQAVLAGMLAQRNDLSLNSRIGLAVSLRDSRPWPSDERNRIALPIMSLETLQSLLSLDADRWRSELLKRASQNRADIDGFVGRLSKLRKGVRIKLYKKLPLNDCDLLLSYWGDLEHLLPELTPADRESMDFSVTSDQGPRHIGVLWSIGPKMFGRFTPTGNLPWCGNLFLTEIEND